MTRLSVPCLLVLCMTVACARSGLSTGEPPDPIGAMNPCGGTALLGGVPLAACGVCGQWRCDGPDALSCDQGMGPNACGDCGPLPEEQCNQRDDNCDGVVDEGCVIRALATSDMETRVRISGDWLVTDVTRRGIGGDIHALHMPSNRVVVVSESTEPPSDVPYARWSAIDDGLVAFYYVGTSFSGVRNIAAYDLETGETFEPPMLLAGQGAPNVDAGRVVFSAQDDATGPYDVFVWTPAAGTLERFGDPDRSELSPDVFGDWLVFEDAEHGEEVFGRHLSALNLATGERLRLSEGLPEGWHVAPAIDGMRVVWHREHGSSAPGREADLYLHDLATGERTVISEGESALHGRIDGDLICWSSTGALNGSGGSWSEGGVVALDLRSGGRRVMNNEAQFCDVSGRRLAWLLRRRSLDPYYYDLLDGEP